MADVWCVYTRFSFECTLIYVQVSSSPLQSNAIFAHTSSISNFNPKCEKKLYLLFAFCRLDSLLYPITIRVTLVLSPTIGQRLITFKCYVKDSDKLCKMCRGFGELLGNLLCWIDFSKKSNRPNSRRKYCIYCENKNTHTHPHYDHFDQLIVSINDGPLKYIKKGLNLYAWGLWNIL